MMRLRIAASLCGILLAVAAVATNDKRLAWAAIGVLVVAFVIRLIVRRRQDKSIPE
jgi:hypothetical protein